MRGNVLLLVVLLSVAASSCDGRKFSCTKRSGDWGLYGEWPEAPELIACFGGMAKSADDERLCKAALKQLEVNNAEEDVTRHFYCSVFP
jgi:hypothetical protein